ncbi:apolipoprotein N-acyltransferase [Amycolatopsis japonica]|uniref:Apolipoprotein N-acyltransferase n=1 Tax=Amycolatopsis japonica TaxID=208439 RepID=A0A075V7G7_9PSEU|nr:apolipoprotein N-acyltransferase [Amycolatopsis japonica]
MILYLSLAPRTWWWLAPVAFAVLGLALHGCRFRQGAGRGFLFGLAFFLPQLSWLQDFLGADFGPWPWLALSVTMALYFAIAGGLSAAVQRLPCGPIWMAAVVIAAETPRMWVPFGGFPWGRIAFTQPEGIFLPLASLGGAPLVGFAAVLCGFGLSRLVLRMREIGWRFRRAILGPALTVVLPIVAGVGAVLSVDDGVGVGSRTVAVLQGNAPDRGLALLGERDSLRENHFAEFRRLIERVREGRVQKPDLVVWPETAVRIPADGDRLGELVNELGVPVLVGALERLSDGRNQNVAVVWEPGEGPGQRYAKQRLVPFGEYMPAREIARLVTPFADSGEDISPGTGSPAVLRLAETVVGASICYEVAYDQTGRDAVRAGAELLTVPTNNAWYGRSEMTYQQLAMARLRAVEHGRAVLVAATSGVSAIIRPDGTVTRASGQFTAETLIDTIPLRRDLTMADRLGPWVEHVLIAAATGAIAATLILWVRARSPERPASGILRRRGKVDTNYYDR